MSGLVLDLAPEAHWGDAGGDLAQSIGLALYQDLSGLAIAAPAQVDLSRHQTLPLSGVRVASCAEQVCVPLCCASVVCACVETGEVCAAPIMAPEVPRDGEGEAPLPPGSAGRSFRLDLFEVAKLPRSTGTWVIRVVLNDVISNAVTVQLVDPPKGDADPSAEAVLRELANKPVIRALNPRPSLGPGLPSYEPQPGTPPTPETPGVRLQIKRAQLLQAKPSLLVHGSFLTRVLPRDVRPPSKEGEKMRGPRATATVPIALVAVASDRVGCKVTPLVVPSYLPLQGEGDALTASGAFTFDYFELAAPITQGQTIFLYAFTGALVSEVAASAFVDLRDYLI